MSDITVKGRPLPYAHVRPLPADRVLAASRGIEANGTDDVIIKVGDSYHIASGRGLPLRGVKPNDPATLEGRPGNVVATDRQLNTFAEGLVAPPGLVVGGGIAALALAGFVQGLLSEGLLAVGSLAGLSLLVAAGGLLVGLGVNALVGVFGEARPADPTQPR
jgi:hypothetical protein